MYYTKEEIKVKYTDLTDDQATAYGNIATKLIDKYLGYNLLNANRTITFKIKNEAKAITLPFGDINSITSIELDGESQAVDYASGNKIVLDECVTDGKLVIQVNAGHGGTANDVDGLAEVFYGMIGQLIQVDRAKGDDGNLASITIGELSKSYATKITNEQAILPLEETVLQP